MSLWNTLMMQKPLSFLLALSGRHPPRSTTTRADSINLQSDTTVMLTYFDQLSALANIHHVAINVLLHWLSTLTTFLLPRLIYLFTANWDQFISCVTRIYWLVCYWDETVKLVPCSRNIWGPRTPTILFKYPPSHLDISDQEWWYSGSVTFADIHASALDQSSAWTS